MKNTDGKRLLILDDSEDLLWILKVFFEEKGYIVKTILNGDEIFSDIKSFQPDLLLMDVLLGGADGRTLCYSLRGHSETEHLGILMTSASPKNLENYKIYKADDCIEKPFDLNSLDQKITSILSWLPIRRKALQ